MDDQEIFKDKYSQEIPNDEICDNCKSIIFTNFKSGRMTLYCSARTNLLGNMYKKITRKKKACILFKK